MNKLLLLQPPRSREKLTAALELAGVSYTQHSFIQITEVASSITDLTTADAIIWVSKNAVMFAKAQRLQLPDKVAMYAVGPSTAGLASKQFNKPCECPTFVHSSEALLKLPELSLIHI